MMSKRHRVCVENNISAQPTVVFELLTVSEIARRLRVAPSWVYSHADLLGAFRLGKYLRFDWVRVLEKLAAPGQGIHSLGSQPNDRSQPT
jgi:hypothetical protein